MSVCKYEISDERLKLLNVFQNENELFFNDIYLLNQAFIHRSFTNENKFYKHNNERLEFLGDSVLGVATASFLYGLMKDKQEGDLAKIKAVVVSEKVLSEVALNMKIDKYLILGRGEELSGGRTKKAILADAMEAIIGAIYLDLGYARAEQFILSFIPDEINRVVNEQHYKDYKTILQEVCQKKYKTCPVYEVVKIEGPDHDRLFWVKVFVSKYSYGPVSGKSKKEAEQAAAKFAYESVFKN